MGIGEAVTMATVRIDMLWMGNGIRGKDEKLEGQGRMGQGPMSG